MHVILMKLEKFIMKDSNQNSEKFRILGMDKSASKWALFLEKKISRNENINKLSHLKQNLRKIM